MSKRYVAMDSPEWRRLPRHERIKRARTIKMRWSKARSKRWIQKAHLKKGLLHREMRIPAGQPIPLAKLRSEHAKRKRELHVATQRGSSAATIHRLRSRLGRTQFALRARGFGKRKRKR